MCGLAGIVGQIDRRNRDALRRMKHAMAHRGPDGEGEWETTPHASGRGVMLAHRRLSILDLSSAGAQPMVDPLTGDVVVLNGEIYNYLDLRDRLSSNRERIESSGDTAVMLRCLGINGREAIRSFRGMFAFAFWDASERKLIIARDPLGIKPLYLARNPDPHGNWRIVFASEVRAILASGLLGNMKLNPRAPASAVWNGFMVTPDTAILGIESVWPGQIRVYDETGEEESSEFYWTADRRCSAAPLVGEAELADRLEKSVHLHLASDVPLGVFLSGGIDSATVANLAHRASQSSVRTFTMAFEEEEYNEGVLARRIASAIGTEHQEVILTEDRFISDLDAALDSLDQPTFDGLNSYYMSQSVREAGFKVALVGTGGDELFGGYTSFRDLPRLLDWRRRSRWIPQSVIQVIAKLASELLQPSRGPIPQQTRWAKLPDMTREDADLLSLYQLAYALFLPEFQRQLLQPTIVDALTEGLPCAMRSRLSVETTGLSRLAAISVMEQRLFLGERLLRDTDATSMAASIEIRVPLVDHVLYESVVGMRDDMRYYPVGKKAILRRIGLRGLDLSLFDRPKTGFTLPYARWLRSRVGKIIDETMRDSAAVRATGLEPEPVRRLWEAFSENSAGLYWSRVWAIYVFVRWCHRHRVFA